MALEDLPATVAPATEEGINDALGAAVTSEDRAKGLAAVLEHNPRAAIRRTLRLNKFQRSALMDMSDDDVRELVAPVRDALRGPNPMGFTVQYREEAVRTGSITVKCTVEAEF